MFSTFAHYTLLFLALLLSRSLPSLPFSPTPQLSCSPSPCLCSDLFRPYRKCLPLQQEGNPWLLHIEIMRGVLGVALLHTTALIASAVCMHMCTSSTASGNFYAFSHILCSYMCACAKVFACPGLCGCALLALLLWVLCVCVQVFVLFIRPPIFSALLLGQTLLLSPFALLCKLLLAPPALIISVRPMAPKPNLKPPLWTAKVSGVQS